MYPSARMHKQYLLTIGPGATYDTYLLDVGADLAKRYASPDRRPATSGLIYFDRDVWFKLNWLDSDPIKLDNSLMGGRFEVAYGDTLIDRIYFGYTEGATVNVNVIVFG